MVEQKIELRKIRDFGEIFNDTFAFIKQEFKPLLRAFLLIGGFFILAAGILGGIYQDDSLSGLLKQFQSGSYNVEDRVEDPFQRIFSPIYFLLIFLSVLSWLVIRILLAVYMKLYVANGNESPTVDAVWKNTLPYLVSVFFYSIVIGILVIIGSVFCLLPGIWLLVVFAPINLVFVIEDASLGTAISRCFQIIKDNFWASFGVYIIAYLIYFVSSSIISVIVGAIAGTASYFSTGGDLSKTIGIVSGILNIFSQLMYIIFFVSVALQYYNLVEIQDGDGLMSRIDTLGNQTTTNTETEEQY